MHLILLMMKNKHGYRSIILAIIVLAQLFSTGCPPPSIGLLSERSYGDQPVIEVIHDDRYYNCFHVHSIDELNALLEQEEIVKVKVELADGSELVGRTVVIADDDVMVRDFGDRVTVVRLESVKSVIPYKEIPGAERREDLLISIFLGALIGSRVDTEGKLINPVGLAIGAAAGAVVGTPLYLPKHKAQYPILNLYNKNVSERTKIGWQAPAQ